MQQVLLTSWCVIQIQIHNTDNNTTAPCVILLIHSDFSWMISLLHIMKMASALVLMPQWLLLHVRICWVHLNMSPPRVKQCTLPYYIIKVIPLPPGLQNSKVPHSVAQYGWFLTGLRCSDVDINRAGSCLSLEWLQCSVEGKIHMFSAVKLAYVFILLRDLLVILLGHPPQLQVLSLLLVCACVCVRVWGTGLLLHCTFFRNICEIFDRWLHQGCSTAVFSLTSWWIETL